MRSSASRLLQRAEIVNDSVTQRLVLKTQSPYRHRSLSVGKDVTPTVDEFGDHSIGNVSVRACQHREVGWRHA